jgi:hypothetical protein
MKYALEFEETSGDSGGFGDVEANNIEDAIEKALKFIRGQAMGEKGTEIDWFIYADTGDVDHDHENKLAKGNLFL